MAHVYIPRIYLPKEALGWWAQFKGLFAFLVAVFGFFRALFATTVRPLALCSPKAAPAQRALRSVHLKARRIRAQLVSRSGCNFLLAADVAAGRA